MADVVQTQCPGCKKVLRIPAQWANQKLKCKYCGKILQVPSGSKSVAATPAARPAPKRSAPEPPLGELPDQLEMRGLPQRPSTLARIMRGVAMMVGLAAVAGGGYFLYRQMDHKGYFQEENPTAAAETTKPATVEKPRAPANAPWPRRLLAIGVHNYLYANPLSPGEGDEQFHHVVNRIANRLRVPGDQTVVLTDVARPAPTDSTNPRARRSNQARSSAADTLLIPPLKGVVQKTITDFVDTCRGQDRFVLLFVGHAVDIDDQAYLVPLEGELTVKESLIPLAWLYEQLEKCKARQKVLLLDVCRYDAGRGRERPGSEAMSEKLDAALQKAPAGVQVWVPCSKDQNSLEVLGQPIFLGKLFATLDPRRKTEGIQEPTDPLPIEPLAKTVNKATDDEVQGDKLGKQTPRLLGKEPSEGTPYNPAEAAATRVVVTAPTLPGGSVDVGEIKSLLAEIAVPPIRLGGTATAPVDAIVPFSAKKMADFRPDYNSLQQLLTEVKADPRKYQLRAATLDAVKVLRMCAEKLNVHETITAPIDDRRKEDFKKDQLVPATLLYELEETKRRMDKLEETRDQEASRRWQANFDYVYAQVLARMAFIHEYNLMLGKIRKDELPTLEKNQSGYRLSSREKMQSKDGRDLATEAKKRLRQVAKEQKGTPWEVLAKRDQLTALGLEWQPVR